MGKGPARKKKVTPGGRAETAVDPLVLAEDPFSESVIESLPGLFYILDEQGRYVRWNKNLESALGVLLEKAPAAEVSI